MHLANDWKLILKKAWSIRFIVLAGVFSGLEIAWPLMQGLLPIPAGSFAIVAFAFTTIAFFARIMAQKDFPNA